MNKQLLVAIDRSNTSANIFHYLGNLFAGCDDVFVHLLSIIPTTVASAGRDWLDESELMNMISPQCRRRFETSERFMVDAKEKLIRKGFSAARITTRVRLSQGSVVKDIIYEANMGLYDALIVGRFGANKLSDMIMGAISSELLEQSHDTPVWVIDGFVDSSKFLVPVDGTNRSLLAVDHLAFVLKGNPNAEITLFNSEAVFAKTAHFIPEDYYEQWTRAWADEHLARSDSLFHAPERLLLDNGFSAERIHSVTTRRGLYPSRQIVRQALVGDYGTIVMGCRPKGLSQGIFKSVTAKVCGMAENVAVWVVECY